MTSPCSPRRPRRHPDDRHPQPAVPARVSDLTASLAADLGARAVGRAFDRWAEQSRRRTAEPDQARLRFAFYGRVSTEDWQDPVTSRARQREQAAALVSGHGRIVAEFFDAGESRTLAWARRPQATALVAALGSAACAR
jgi:hypothetical protein